VPDGSDARLGEIDDAVAHGDGVWSVAAVGEPLRLRAALVEAPDRSTLGDYEPLRVKPSQVGPIDRAPIYGDSAGAVLRVGQLHWVRAVSGGAPHLALRVVEAFVGPVQHIAVDRERAGARLCIG
jgi:hypothetical protein